MWYLVGNINGLQFLQLLPSLGGLGAWLHGGRKSNHGSFEVLPGATAKETRNIGWTFSGVYKMRVYLPISKSFEIFSVSIVSHSHVIYQCLYRHTPTCRARRWFATSAWSPNPVGMPSHWNRGFFGLAKVKQNIFGLLICLWFFRKLYVSTISSTLGCVDLSWNHPRGCWLSLCRCLNGIFT